MSARQTSVSDQTLFGFAGMAGDSSFKRDKSAVNAGATELPFGTAAKITGLAEDGLTFKVGKLTSDNDVVGGIVMADPSLAKDTELGDTGIKQYASLNLRQQGPVWVLVDDTGVGIGPNAEVHVMAVPGMGEVAGSFRASADGIKTINVTKYCRWESAVQDGPGGTKVALLWADFSGAGLGVTDS